MTDVWEGSSMKGEGKILNAICLLIGLAFIGLIVWNFISAGSFIAIDSLFALLQRPRLDALCRRAFADSFSQTRCGGRIARAGQNFRREDCQKRRPDSRCCAGRAEQRAL